MSYYNILINLQITDLTEVDKLLVTCKILIVMPVTNVNQVPLNGYHNREAM